MKNATTKNPVPESPPLLSTELMPDAWDRFERAVDVVSKSGPQHRKLQDGPKKLSSKKERPIDRDSGAGGDG
jgi:hypothetical protein